jgi:hypothetical protein
MQRTFVLGFANAHSSIHPRSAIRDPRSDYRGVSPFCTCGKPSLSHLGAGLSMR